MANNDTNDETIQWLNYLQPEGLVLSPNVLRHSGLTPIRQTPLDSEEAVAALGLPSDHSATDDKSFVLRDAWGFFENILRWPASLVAGAPGGPELPDLSFAVAEQGTVLKPNLALVWNGEPTDKAPVQALVSLYPDLPPDDRKPFGEHEWEASPHQRLERLLRETEVGVGILVARGTLRLIYAPRGETAGWISWPLAALGRVEGRPMLAGLKVALGREAFFVGEPTQRLRPLLRASREAQNEVSEKLSGQVLAALYELLRGIHQAAPDEVEALAEQQPHHLYEGLLTCLMRLVFLLYAEDRDLLPTHTEDGLKALWESGYSIKTLYARLLADQAVNPDTMDQRRGAWGQLLSVFRIIHAGHPDWVAARGGKLFDPDAFSFLEARGPQSTRADGKVMPVSDGMVLRILDGLMMIDGRGLAGERIRERLSYRSLDVESIGSVYETVMGFTAKRASEPMIAVRDEKKLPNFIGLETLLAAKPADRQKWLKDQSIKLAAGQLNAVKAASTVDELVAGLGNAIDKRASANAAPIGKGVPYLQPTDERRRSGSHYTPRSLTEPIVRHALEPAFERIGDNASPEAVLSLKVLDPACGSGAFLVEACRQLGARLEQAWDMHKAEKPIIPPDEDEVIHARRLVAQRCLYGVDRNPMAVDLARLSLWLATLAREHEFTFLDHAIKAGDSLVGLTQHEIEAANWDATKPGLPYIRILLKDRLQRVVEGREAIRTAPDDVTRAIQQSRHDRVEEQLEVAREIGDAVIAAFFSADKPRSRELERQKVESILAAPIGLDQTPIRQAAHRFRAQQGWRPFHWEIEFPEVFLRDNPGFDSIVGNPPFLGGRRISTASSAGYFQWISSNLMADSGKADLVSYFVRRVAAVTRNNGTFGILATSSITEGHTRKTSLRWLTRNAFTIYAARRKSPWPGEANVHVSMVVAARGAIAAPYSLDGAGVEYISSSLTAVDLDADPTRLASNIGECFEGCVPYGNGFVFDDYLAGGHSIAQMHKLLEVEPAATSIIRPYIGGDEITDRSTVSTDRFVISVGRMTERELADGWPLTYELMKTTIKPDRAARGERIAKSPWWQFLWSRPRLMAKMTRMDSVIVTSRVSKFRAFAFLPTKYIPSTTLTVITKAGHTTFSVLQSRVHEFWALALGSSRGETSNYSPTGTFETFPFPPNYETDGTLEAIGNTYHNHRAELMVAANEGMTKTYNRFHKESETGPAIQRLRELHDEMDRAVLRAYGWDDLADTLQPEFLTEDTEDDHTYQGRYFWPAAQRDQVLSRLLALNAERYKEELKAGLHEKGKKRGRQNEDDELDFDAND